MSAIIHIADATMHAMRLSDTKDFFLVKLKAFFFNKLTATFNTNAQSVFVWLHPGREEAFGTTPSQEHDVISHIKINYGNTACFIGSMSRDKQHVDYKPRAMIDTCIQIVTANEILTPA